MSVEHQKFQNNPQKGVKKLYIIRGYNVKVEVNNQGWGVDTVKKEKKAGICKCLLWE